MITNKTERSACYLEEEKVPLTATFHHSSASSSSDQSFQVPTVFENHPELAEILRNPLSKSILGYLQTNVAMKEG